MSELKLQKVFLPVKIDKYADTLKEHEGYFFTADELELFSIGLVDKFAQLLKDKSKTFSAEDVYNEYIKAHGK